MKKLSLYLIAFILPFAAPGKGKPIEQAKLPAAAQEFIARYFAEAKVSLATIDQELFETTYDVIFADGRSIEFDGKGQWKDVDCQRSRLPEGIVPEAIAKHLATNYSKRFASEINRDRYDWDVTLDNGLELTFDTEFRLIEIDD